MFQKTLSFFKDDAIIMPSTKPLFPYIRADSLPPAGTFLPTGQIFPGTAGRGSADFN
jgi:hypothetical protein